MRCLRQEFDWKKSAEITNEGELESVVRDSKEQEVFVLRVKDLRTMTERARARATLTAGSELMVRYGS